MTKRLILEIFTEKLKRTPSPYFNDQHPSGGLWTLTWDFDKLNNKYPNHISNFNMHNEITTIQPNEEYVLLSEIYGQTGIAVILSFHHPPPKWQCCMLLNAGLVYWGTATARVISRRWNDDEISFLVEETGIPGGNHRPTASNWWNFFTHTASAQSGDWTWAAAVWSKVS